MRVRAKKDLRLLGLGGTIIETGQEGNAELFAEGNPDNAFRLVRFDDCPYAVMVHRVNLEEMPAPPQKQARR